MSANRVDASELALDFLSRRYRDSIELVPVDALPAPVYGFEPNGWYLFAVIEQRSFRTGGGEYVAVSQRTGEVRDLGRLG